MKPTFMLVGERGIPFLFDVPPMDFKCQTAQDTTIVKIIDLGEILIPGKRKVKTISFSTFLPGLKSPFINLTNPVPPAIGVDILEKWKSAGKPVTLVIPEYNVFYKCYIKTFDWGVSERTGDFDVSITLEEEFKNKSLVDPVVGLFVR